MFQSKILRTNKKLLENAKILNANDPNFIVLPLKIEDKTLSEKVEVEGRIEVGQTIATAENIALISPVSGKVKAIEEMQNFDNTHCVIIEIENAFLEDKKLKKLINPTQEDLQLRAQEAGILPLCTLQRDIPISVDARDTKYTLGLNGVLLKKYGTQILKGCQLVKKLAGVQAVKLLVEKDDLEAVLAQRNKLNLLFVEVVVKAKKALHQTLDLQTAFDLYDATEFGNIKTKKFIAVAGQSIKTPSYYLVRINTPIEELMQLAGGLKHTYEEIEAFKDQAMIAVNDEIVIKEDIEAATGKEKEDLKNLLLQKKAEANKTIFKYFKENQQKYGLCLSNMMLLTKNGAYSVNSTKNAVTDQICAALFLSNKEYKNKTRKN